MADLLWRRDRLDEAQALASRALSIEIRELGADHPAVASTLNTLGVIHADAGHYGKALDSYQRALAIRLASLGPDHPSVARTHSNIALTYGSMEQYDDAEAHFVEAIRIFESAPSSQSDAQANRRALTDMLGATDRPGKARASEQR